MKKPLRLLVATASLPVIMALSGCSLLYTRRKLPIPIAPATVHTATASELISKINEQWDGMQTLVVKADMQATLKSSCNGVATDYPAFRSNILMRKPFDLRVRGSAPVVMTHLFDMTSDGSHFTLYAPPKKMAAKGSAKVKKSAMPLGCDAAKNSGESDTTKILMNLRPGFFFDAMMVHGFDKDDLYSVVSDSNNIEDPSRKKIYFVPEYQLNIMHRSEAGQEIKTLRVVHFHREDLLPYQQDIYDEQSNLETQIYYSKYQDFNGVHYPSQIVIKRPQEEIQLTLRIEVVTMNAALKDDSFHFEIPVETKIIELEK